LHADGEQSTDQARQKISGSANRHARMTSGGAAMSAFWRCQRIDCAGDDDGR
jgi:hypothetical protein